MNTLFGMPVFESPLVQPVPKLQMSPSFKWCSDECRRETDAWLLDLFGTKEVLYLIDAGALGIGSGHKILMNPRHAAILRTDNNMFSNFLKPQS